MQQTLVLIKPDAVQRGLAGQIISRLEGRGLKIVGMKLLRISDELARRHYAVHDGKPFFAGLVRFITSAPVIALVAEGDNAISVVRNTMGKTNPVEADPGTIRGDWALDLERNLIHGSDAEETARTEVSIFFNENELVSYSRDIDRWITGSAKED